MLEANCYVVAAEEGAEAVAIDPGGDADVILAAAQAQGFALRISSTRTVTRPHRRELRPEGRHRREAVHPCGGPGMIEGSGREWALTGSCTCPAKRMRPSAMVRNCRLVR